MNELKKFLKDHGLPVEECLEKLEIFSDMIIERNKMFNLTAITDKREMEIKHFLDSLHGSRFLSDRNLDVGSGAGFPGIPLAIANRDKRFVLVDSLRKRVDFLEEVKEACGLENVSVLHRRAEDMDRTEKFGCVTARAVAPLNVLCEYCLPFVKVGGIMLAYKGRKADEEIGQAEKALEILGGAVERKEPYTISFDGEVMERNLVVVRKTRETPEKYPRGGNKPRIKPL